MTKKMLTWTMLGLLTLLLAACGSNRDAGDSIVGGEDALANAAPLGIRNCLTCHQGGNVAPLVADIWVDGPHGNPDASPNSLTNPDCLTCHDQLGDGAALAPARPVVSCESCHGGGQFHLGISAGIPYPQPGSARCGQCHNASFPHGFAPEGLGIAEAYDASPHARSLNDHVFADASGAVRARCAKCHSDEGAKQYLNVDGNYAFLSSALPNSLPPQAGARAIQCTTCHTPHAEQTLLESETLQFGTVVRSSQFNTCTNCHQLVNSDLTRIIAYHDPAANPYGALGEIITDTHFATPGNFPGGGNRGVNLNNIGGYAMNFADARVCLNCHNPHDADTTINQQWAASKHADTSAAGAWAHYNWTEVPGALRADGSATSDRTTCQRCHTTRGYLKMATETLGNTAAYVPFNDHQPSYKPEMLHCNACHSDNRGGLRTLGAVTVGYTNAPATYPDARESNLCLACHTGLASGDSITNSPADFSNTAFINSHYLTAGGTVFARTGYHYGGRGYALSNSDDHHKIGLQTTGFARTFNEAGLHQSGPCIGCHYTSDDGSHTLSPYSFVAATGNTALNPMCANSCHADRGPGGAQENSANTWLGKDFTVDDLAAGVLAPHKGRYLAALEALRIQLAAQGFNFTEGFPYFANTNWVTAADATGKLNMGAAFNYNLLIHDPGGVTHNRRYTRRLIYDSIDHLDDGLLNYSVSATLNALDDTVPYKTSAISYLIAGGTAGTAGERY